MHRQHDQAFISPISLGNVVCKCTIMKLQNESARLLLSAFPPSCPLRAGVTQTNKPEWRGGSSLACGDAQPQGAAEGASCMGVQAMGAPGALRVAPIACSIPAIVGLRER